MPFINAIRNYETLYLGAGATTDVIFGPTNPLPGGGEYYIRIITDSTNTITETNEENNMCTRTGNVYLSCQDPNPIDASNYGGIAQSNCLGQPNYNPSSTYDDGWCRAKNSNYTYCCYCPQKFGYDPNTHECFYQESQCDDGTYCTGNPWTDPPHCLRASAIPYEDGCCLDESYGGDNYYSWIVIEVNSGAAQAE